MGRRADAHQFMPGKWVFPGGRVDRADYRAKSLQDLQPAVLTALAGTARLKSQNGPRLARALAVAAIRETFEETGLVLGRMDGARCQADLGNLSYIARAITPPARTRRFDARFLMADAEHLLSLEPMDSRELGDVAWFTLAECRDLDLPAVTRAVLDLVGRQFEGVSAEIPFWRMR
jgi:8-oxo-dGTP pyrophosphatase MutT (NUDIX family)